MRETATTHTQTGPERNTHKRMAVAFPGRFCRRSRDVPRTRTEQYRVSLVSCFIFFLMLHFVIVELMRRDIMVTTN